MTKQDVIAASLLALVCCSVVPHVETVEERAVEPITVPGGLTAGFWGDAQFCSAGGFAYSFDIKYAPLGFADDTAVNAVKLYCRDAGGSLTEYLVSAEGKWGDWVGVRFCPTAEFLTGFSLNIVPPQGLKDDLGVDNMRMSCENGTLLDGLYGVPIQKHNQPSKYIHREIVTVQGRQMEKIGPVPVEPRDHGDWSVWAYCSGLGRVCGLQTRLEPEDVVSDDAGTTDVILFCCS